MITKEFLSLGHNCFIVVRESNISLKLIVAVKVDDR